FLQDPYPVYRSLLENNPTFFHDTSKMWFFTRHADVDGILRDRRFGRSILHMMTREELDLPPENPAYEPFYKLGRHSMFDKEPPEPTRLRGLVHEGLTRRRIRNLQASIQAAADVLADKADHRGRIDLLADFAAPLSVRVIATLRGIPEADQHRL